ncbi:MAG: transglutaminase domain-containing protein [Nitrospinota bacterium]|nr:transglutaminase domain-containing protein [Nitrospinota bacterium]
MKTPPFLLTSVLLFWGWQTNQIMFAVPLALILEGSRVTPTRFELSALEFHRVWTLCLLALIIVLAIPYITNKGLGSIYTLLQWIPLVLFPIVAAQLYSARGNIPTETFNIFYRKKESGNNEAFQNHIDLLYPYFSVCILAACAVTEKNPGFYWGMGLLCAWAFWGVRPKRFSWITWSVSWGLIVWLGFWGGEGLYKFRNYVDAQVIDWLSKRFRSDDNPFKSRTAIGEIVDLKMDDAILFYVDYKKGALRKTLLPQATYNIYKGGAWYAAQSKFTNFISLTSTENQWTFEKKLEPEKIIQVSMDLHKGKGLLLAPNQAFRFDNLPVLYMQTNPMGAVQVEKGPEFVEYDVAIHPQVSRNISPNINDLKIPIELRPVFQQLAAELQLASKSPSEILKTVDQYFEKNFYYSLNLTRSNREVPPLKEFLMQTRKGHCEYFATAAALLLRQAGIPARYTFGYSAHEYNWMQENLVVRSRDAHAWVIAYVDGEWRNFDATPSVWIDQQEAEASLLEKFSDVWSQMGYLFSYVRWSMEDESFRIYLVWALIPPILYLAWRIYSRARRVRQGGDGATSSGALYKKMASDFHLIENKLNQLGFAREDWETYSNWLRRIHREYPGAPVSGLAEAVTLYSRERFDPQGITPEEEERLKTEIQSWLEAPR